MLRVNKTTNVLKNQPHNPNVSDDTLTLPTLLHLMGIYINNHYITHEIFDTLKNFPFLMFDKKNDMELLYYKMGVTYGINLIKYKCDGQTKITGIISKIGVGSIHQYNYNQYICVTKIDVHSEKHRCIYDQKYRLISCTNKDSIWGGNDIIKKENPIVRQIIYTKHSIYYIIINSQGNPYRDFYRIKNLPDTNNVIIAEIIDFINNAKSVECIAYPNYSVSYCKYNVEHNQYEFHKIVKKNAVLIKHVILSTTDQFIWYDGFFESIGKSPLLIPKKTGDLYLSTLKTFGTTNYTFIHKLVDLDYDWIVPNINCHVNEQYIHINNKYKCGNCQLIMKTVKPKHGVLPKHGVKPIHFEKILKKNGSYFSYKQTPTFEMYNFNNNDLRIYLYNETNGHNYGEIFVNGCNHKYVNSQLVTNPQCQCSQTSLHILDYENVFSYLNRKNIRVKHYYDLVLKTQKKTLFYSKYEKKINITNDLLKSNLNYIDLISQSNDNHNVKEHSFLPSHKLLGIGDLIEKIYDICKQYIEDKNSKITVNINIKDGELNQTYIFENDGNSQTHVATLNDEVIHNKITTGWKICKTIDKRIALVQLSIPTDAIVIYAYKSNKYRTNKAYVEKIYGIEQNDASVGSANCCKYKTMGEYDQAWNHIHRIKILYEKGKNVEVSDFDQNAENCCSAGIHFCDTMEAAYSYIK